jgi:hypothetical protein
VLGAASLVTCEELRYKFTARSQHCWLRLRHSATGNAAADSNAHHHHDPYNNNKRHHSTKSAEMNGAYE